MKFKLLATLLLTTSVNASVIDLKTALDSMSTGNKVTYHLKRNEGTFKVLVREYTLTGKYISLNNFSDLNINVSYKKRNEQTEKLVASYLSDLMQKFNR